jgi:hypothetical protein
MRNPWLDIPLAEYEGHMSLPTIGQAEMLAEQFESQLRTHTPISVAVLGCAGGNGFDRISPAITKRVVAIDINPGYIEEISNRYAKGLRGFEAYAHDIQQPGLDIAPVEFIYAGLVFEYVQLRPTFNMLKSLCKTNGVLAVVLQAPSESLGAISNSPFTSLRALAPLMRLIQPADLEAIAAEAGFVPCSCRSLVLPSGKEFAVQVFRLSTARDSF